ncbi:MAG: FAD binding domain-containing protein [Lachnospiraceae bacterium]
MLKIKNYVMPETMEEAYELNQKKSTRILAGCGWIRMSNGTVQTAIDLSRLGLDKIEETEEEFIIGAMVTLRQLECHKGLNDLTKGAVRESVRHIVGTQFRNCATIGGSIFGRFGFSDLCTCFLAMHTEVKLYNAGRVSIENFMDMPKNTDILTHIIVKKIEEPIVYISQRNTATDFPVIACCVAKKDGKFVASVGARPKQAKLIVDEEEIMKNGMSEENCQKFAQYVVQNLDFGTNIRATAEYRKYLAKVLVKRACQGVLKMEEK